MLQVSFGEEDDDESTASVPDSVEQEKTNAAHRRTRRRRGNALVAPEPAGAASQDYDDEDDLMVAEQPRAKGGGIGNILFGVLFSIGGLSGKLAFRGTNSSVLLVVVGIGLLIWGVVQNQRGKRRIAY